MRSRGDVRTWMCLPQLQAVALIFGGLRVVRGVPAFGLVQVLSKIGQPPAQSCADFRQFACAEKQEADDKEQNQFPEAGHVVDAFFRQEVRQLKE